MAADRQGIGRDREVSNATTTKGRGRPGKPS